MQLPVLLYFDHFPYFQFPLCVGVRLCDDVASVTDDEGETFSMKIKEITGTFN